MRNHDDIAVWEPVTGRERLLFRIGGYWPAYRRGTSWGDASGIDTIGSALLLMFCAAPAALLGGTWAAMLALAALTGTTVGLGRRRRRHLRIVPRHFLPFDRAELRAYNAKGALSHISPLLHLGPAEIQTTLDRALWDAAELARNYLAVRKAEWETRRAADNLPDDHGFRHRLHIEARVLRSQGDDLNTAATDACERIDGICTEIIALHRGIAAEEAAHAALRSADRRGAYSTWSPDRTQDLSDRVAGLTVGLNEIGKAA